ncbi:MAG TPA: DUF4926 domain-containing protein [Bryobacteraceae bacterium]|nr:DUF4926 domain-containing protein [Bryobacterales bacterium]HRJ17973.1 DUF4926 domain-containing protein [Bryobacteraceae bacterium]
MPEPEMLSLVALLEDLPGQGLVHGQVGTFVEQWAPDVFEVEFSDDHGRTCAMAALHSSQLLKLHNEPVPQVA